MRPYEERYRDAPAASGAAQPDRSISSLTVVNSARRPLQPDPATYQGQTRYGRKRQGTAMSGRDPAVLPACVQPEGD